MTFSRSGTQHKRHSISTLYHYAECLILFIIMLNGIMLSVVMLSVVGLNKVILSVVMLSEVMLSVIMLSVAILSVMAPFLRVKLKPKLERIEQKDAPFTHKY